MHLDPLAIITAFGLIFLAELPDKTMFASLAMGTRMRPLYVWFGTSSAFVVHVAIAVGAGSLIGLLPDWIVKLVSASLFAFGAFMLLRGSGGDDDEDAEVKTVTGFWPVYTTAFMAVFISEWGDLTQITTANLAASNGTWSTAIGAGRRPDVGLGAGAARGEVHREARTAEDRAAHRRDLHAGPRPLDGRGDLHRLRSAGRGRTGFGTPPVRSQNSAGTPSSVPPLSKASSRCLRSRPPP
ncbi:putative Ca2+/H+ antiporter (TMEM165/GDT1 family) [Streptomyces sp. HB372]|nr:putative Ca2+/H+ antiporter (TMEM165/GDT1 family) [Streptomyces sp. HB372]